MSNILGNMPPVFGSGYRGVVPAPSAADVSAQNILRADGTWGATPGGAIPSQTGNAGKLLTTDGTNASWASSLNTFQFGDVTLGTSGPSVKSSLSARAPRQGLVFDGTQVPIATSISSIGTGDYSWAAYVTNRAIPTAASFVVGVNDSGSDFGGNRSALMTLADGTLQLIVANATTSLGAADTKTNLWVVTRSGTTLTVYKNGVSVTTTTDSQTYGSSYFRMGGYATSNALWQGGTIVPAIYNRALSASEVVALYEAGAPAGADYGLIGQPASNTSIITGDSSTFTGGVGNWTGFNGGSISAVGGKGVISMASYHQGATNNTNQMVAGRRYRLTVTVSALAGGSYVLLTDYNSVEYASLTAGVNVVEFISRSNTGIAFKQGNSGTTSASVDDISLLPIGLLLAPDAAQAGGGLVWYDTSGNAANITLPASGVSWNVPTSGYWGGNLTISKSSTTTGPVLQLENTNDAIDAGGTLGRLQFYSGDDSGGGNSVRAWIDSIQTTTTPVGSALRFAVANGANAAGEVVRIAETGNFLLGTTTDVGPRLLSKAKDNTYAGAGIGIVDQSAGTSYITRANGTFYISNNGSTDHFALDASGNATFAGAVTVSGADKVLTVTSSASTPGFTMRQTGGIAANRNWGIVINNSANGDFILRRSTTTSGDPTTAVLTFDSTGDATFAGKITANGAGSTFKGTATNDSAAAGYVGEIITSTVESGSAVSLSNTVISDVTSISLTAGDWDVDGNVGYSTSGATVTQFLQGIATASGTAGPTGSYSKNPMSLSSDSNSWFQDAPTWRVSISSTTTIYLIARSYFSAGTVAAYGFIRARRVR